ncbi:Regulation of transcription from pol ii promoter-related protein [Mycena venus]|uniref:Regulation of transcription from pol ii promoter-related protein n=1 Tax=Mycena venus TaxID=2733690 RepID=A0A8H6Y900_9AGAR|nr:Regulation of transcription from pol ii promoter-related protein [Mycena venus]
MSSVHATRAKKWETNPFIAEWFANAVAYCQTKDGKKAFEVWLVNEYGKEMAKQRLLDCQKPPRKQYGLPAFGNHKLFNAAASEFGISDEAMKEYHMFTADSNLCVPPRTKPAPKRRRGETSTEWLARRHDALLAGCKIPDIDWRIARAMAISEFDKARDTFEIWHSDIPMFIQAIGARAPTTLINPEIKVGSPEEAIYKMDYAFRACLHAVTLSYMTWGHAVDVFEELDRRGLTTTSSIERAYKQDSALMWRLVGCLCKISYLAGHLWERFTEIMSWCDYYRPFFKRYRTPSRQESRVEIDHAYLKRHKDDTTPLDSVIINSIETDSSYRVAFFDNVLKCLDQDPTEAKKFSNEAFQELGDLATAHEFKAQMIDSAFGQRLMEFAESKDKQCLEDPNFLPNATFIDPSKIHWVERNSNDWSYARTVCRAVGNSWLVTTNRMSMGPFFVLCLPSSPGQERLPFVFDEGWRTIDTALWEFSRALDRSNDKGTVAKKFGLFDPTDPERPTCMKALYKQVRVLSERLRPQSAPVSQSSANVPPAKSQPIVASPTVAASGHAYLSNTQHLRAKEKVKTRGGAPVEVPVDIDVADEEEGEEILPDFLPQDFKIGKKLLKVFHRILQAPDLPETDNDQGPRLGQIRWAEFERAMKRIGFGIAQTAGSSVRFDPPAKSARPITFHRPHPDSILTPIMLKWIGARLKRCYGWTTATFDRAPVDGDN